MAAVATQMKMRHEKVIMYPHCRAAMLKVIQCSTAVHRVNLRSSSSSNSSSTICHTTPYPAVANMQQQQPQHWQQVMSVC
jgi:hypothetical protein